MAGKDSPGRTNPPKKVTDPVVEEPVQAPYRSDRELTYEQAEEAGYLNDPMVKEYFDKNKFVEVAKDPGIQQYREQDVVRNENISDYNEKSFNEFVQTQEAEATTNWESRVAKFQTDFTALGQGDPEVQIDYQNLAELSMQLLSTPGDDEDAVSARQAAAIVLSQYKDALAPHILALNEEWWGDHYQEINANLPDEPSNWKKGLDIVFNSDIGQWALSTLEQTEQGAMQTLMGLESAVTDDGVSAGDALKHAGSSFLQGVGGFAEKLIPGLDIDAVGIDSGERFMTAGDSVLSADRDGDGRLNLREAVGLDPHAGGRVAGVFDTVGMAALDPLSWVSLGTSGRVKAAVSTLRNSSDDVARRAGVQIFNGASLRSLDDVSQLAVEQSLKQSTTEAVMNMTEAQLRRAGYRSSKRSIVTNLFREVTDLDNLRSTVIKQRTTQIDDAIRRGSVPGLRIGGNTVVPMRRVYDALGIIDTRLASDAAWSRQILKTANLTEVEELIGFVHSFKPGTEMPDELKDQMRQWSVLSTRLSGDPAEFMDDILRQSDNAAQTFEEFEAFGRALLGDKGVADWQNYFDNWRKGDAITDPGAPGFSATAPGPAPVSTGTDLTAAVRKAEADGTTVTQAAKDLNLEDLPLASARKVQRNKDIIENPGRWGEQHFDPRGLRSIKTADNVVGDLVRRVSDKFSTRAGVRRAVSQDTQTASQVDNAMTIASAKRDLFTDHINRLGLDRKGESAVAVAASKETSDLWGYVTRALVDEDNLKDLLKSIIEVRPNTHQLISTLQDVRRSTFDLSVASGADEVSLLERRGYMPRVLTDDARKTAEKALQSGDGDVISVFENMGVISDGVVGGSKNPLSQGGHLGSVTYERQLQDIFEVNKKAQDDLTLAGMDGADGFRLYEDNPMRAMLLRSRQAHEAHVYGTMLDELTKVDDLVGRPLAYVSRTADENADLLFRMEADAGDFGRGSYAKITLPNGAHAFVDRTVKTEMDNARRIMGAPNVEGTMRGFMEEWNNVWGAYATVPLVGFGFHARNGVGNVFNMILAGANDPRILADAALGQRKMAEIRGIMRDTGQSWDTVVKGLDIDEGLANTLRQARKYDIVGSGQTADIFSGFDPLSGASTKNPLNQNNAVVASGRAVGTTIENNARLALFMDGMNKGMPPAEAAARVRTHLFDYGDLTSFEANNVRMLSRFYTFMRKNTALQFQMMLTQPGRVANADRLMGEFVNTLLWSEGEEVEPGSHKDGIAIPPWAEAHMRLFGGGTLVGVDTPQASFLSTLQAASAVLKAPAGLALMATAEPGLAREQAGNDMRQQLREALTLFSGGPVEGVKTLFELTSGVDAFTGGSLEDEGGLDLLFRLTDTVIPVGGKLNREAEGYFGEDADPGMRLLNSLLGLTVMEGMDDPEKFNRAMTGTAIDIGNILKEAKYNLDEDQRLTMDDLVEMGELNARNRVMEYLIYNTVAGQPLNEEQRSAIQRFAPATVLEAYGIDVPEKERSEWDLEQKVAKVTEMAQAIEALGGPEVTPDMIMALVLRESGARISDVEAEGIEASFRDNPYLDGEKPEDYEEKRRAESLDQLTQLAAAFGMTVDEFRASRPLIQPAERKASQLREAGYTEQEIIDELITDLSRQEQALLFGEDSLERSFSYEPLTPAEVIKVQQKASRAEAELRLLTMMTTGLQPSQAQVDEWLSEVMFTAPDQRRMGFDNYNAPSRDNVTTDETYDERFQQQLDAVQAGSSFLEGQG